MPLSALYTLQLLSSEQLQIYNISLNKDCIQIRFAYKIVVERDIDEWNRSSMLFQVISLIYREFSVTFRFDFPGSNGLIFSSCINIRAFGIKSASSL